MNQALNYQDIIKRSVMQLMPQNVAIGTLILSLGIALLVGIGIFLVYKRYFLGVVYDHTFNISLVIMTLLVTIIIITISSNITLSLGMVGALSIVRYRTAVKNPLDLMFMFWAITTGISVGAGYYSIAIACFVCVTLTFWLLSKIKSGSKNYVLIINYENELEIEEEIRRILHKYNAKLRSKVIRGQKVEMTMEISFKIENINLANSLSEIKGINDVSLVQYRSSYEL